MAKRRVVPYSRSVLVALIFGLILQLGGLLADVDAHPTHMVKAPAHNAVMLAETPAASTALAHATTTTAAAATEHFHTSALSGHILFGTGFALMAIVLTWQLTGSRSLAARITATSLVLTLVGASNLLALSM